MTDAPTPDVSSALDGGGTTTTATDDASTPGGDASIVPPTPTDGVKNGDETDVDCGGATAPKCVAGKACVAHEDCTSGACPAGTCSESPSCKQKAGGATCGAGEVGDANAKHEDCCVSAVVPRADAAGGPFKMDKYLITAGRMRTFLESVSYDVKGYIAAHRPTWWTGNGAKTWDAMLPSNKTEFLAFTVASGHGCYIGTKPADSGAPAYWATAAELANAVGGGPRTYAQDELDTKVMNCFRAPLFHALCAFDGGHLPSEAQWTAARTVDGVVRPYPWGSNGSEADRSQRASYNFDYSWPRKPNDAADADWGGYLPAPGRFPLGYGPYGHADLLGSVENMGVVIAKDGSATGDGWFQFSFQEPEQLANPKHPYAQSYVGFGTGAYAPHWAVGARCVKD